MKRSKQLQRVQQDLITEALLERSSYSIGAHSSNALDSGRNLNSALVGLSKRRRNQRPTGISPPIQSAMDMTQSVQSLTFRNDDSMCTSLNQPLGRVEKRNQIQHQVYAKAKEKLERRLQKISKMSEARGSQRNRQGKGRESQINEAALSMSIGPTEKAATPVNEPVSKQTSK